MNNRDTIKEELKALNSTLDAEANAMPLSLPEGYFEGFASSVVSRLKNEPSVSVVEELQQISPLLANIPRTMPHSVPANYFQSNIESLRFLIAESESPVFANRQMPFEVPSDYFNHLPLQIMQRVSKPQARVVPMMHRKLIRLAIAAMITGMIAVSGVFYFNSKRDVSVNSPQWVADKLKNVPDKAIEDFVKTTDANAASMVTTHKQTRSAESRKLLQDISDKELDAFLQEVPAEEELEVN